MICASRTKGDTKKIIEEFAKKEKFKLIETITYQGDETLNPIRAKELYKLILEIFNFKLSSIKQNLYEIEKLKPKKIVLEELKGIRGAPWRHPLMIETIKHLSSFRQEINLLEIGTFIGSSLLTWAHAGDKYLKKMNIICIDPLSSFEKNYRGGGLSKINEIEELTRFHFAYHIFINNIEAIKQKYPNVNITFLRNSSKDILPYLQAKSFDLIYIDGDHSYEGTYFDLTNAINLIKDGGLLCGDDLELEIDDIDIDFAEKNKNIDFIQDPRTKENYHPGVTLAVGETIDKVSNYCGYWITQKKDSNFNLVKLNIDSIEIPPHLESKEDYIYKELNKCFKKGQSCNK